MHLFKLFFKLTLQGIRNAHLIIESYES